MNTHGMHPSIDVRAAGTTAGRASQYCWHERFPRHQFGTTDGVVSGRVHAVIV